CVPRGSGGGSREGYAASQGEVRADRVVYDVWIVIVADDVWRLGVGQQPVDLCRRHAQLHQQRAEGVLGGDLAVGYARRKATHRVVQLIGLWLCLSELWKQRVC